MTNVRHYKKKDKWTNGTYGPSDIGTIKSQFLCRNSITYYNNAFKTLSTSTLTYNINGQISAK